MSASQGSMRISRSAYNASKSSDAPSMTPPTGVMRLGAESRSHLTPSRAPAPNAFPSFSAASSVPRSAPQPPPSGSLRLHRGTDAPTQSAGRHAPQTPDACRSSSVPNPGVSSHSSPRGHAYAAVPPGWNDAGDFGPTYYAQRPVPAFGYTSTRPVYTNAAYGSGSIFSWDNFYILLLVILVILAVVMLACLL